MEEIKIFYEKFHKKKNHLLNKIMEDLRYGYLKKEASKYPGKILVIGCGSKREMTLVSEGHKEVWGIDISQTAIDKMKSLFPKYNFEVMDACKMKFNKDYFDTIICSEVIEHLSKRKIFLKKVSTILKSKGKFILTTPNWWSLYGLARYLGEKITKKKITSDNQPIDEWAKPNELIKEVEEQKFKIIKIRGLWYYPPFGKGDYRLPQSITYPLYKFGLYFEKRFSKAIPKLGHMIAITMENRKE